MLRKTFFYLIVIVLVFAAGFSSAIAQDNAPQTTAITQNSIGSAFTYQGQLKNASGLVTGVCDFEFTLWEGINSTAELGKQAKTNISVSAGLFTIPDLDFGPYAFLYDYERWLGIAVRCPAGSGSYTALSPRQRVAPVPYSLFSKSTGSLINRPLAMVAPQTDQVLKWDGTQWAPAPDEKGAGGESSWLLTGNSGTDPTLNRLGTTDNVALTLVVSNSAALRLFPNLVSPNLIGGSSINTVTVGVYGATIAGGGDIGNPNAVLGNFGVVGGGHGNQAGNSFATVGGGGGNRALGNDSTVAGGVLNTADGKRSTVSGGTDNTASGQYATVPGGTSNSAAGDYSLAAGQRAKAINQGTFVWADSTANDLTSTADNQFLVRASGGMVFTSSFGSLLRMLPNLVSPNLVGGESNNTISPAVVGGVIGGGGGVPNYVGDPGPNLYGASPKAINEADVADPCRILGDGVVVPGPNLVTDDYGYVGGGLGNQAGLKDEFPDRSPYATVGGGCTNIAYEWGSTVSGGERNAASGTHATVAGGRENESRANYSVVSGGVSNIAGGEYATVPGGSYNVAQGQNSFAAGKYAYANHAGAFVWADSSSSAAYYFSQRDNQFLVRAIGGVHFDVNNSRWVEIRDDGLRLINTSTGAHLNVGGGWMNASDRNSKENFATVDGLHVLDQLAQIPISTWNYKAEPESVRHMGPMAQDMYAAFALGDSAKTIGTIDADGVALVSIQGLYQLVKEQDATIRALQAESEQLETRLAALENRPAQGFDLSSITTWFLPLALLIVGGGVGIRRQIKRL